MLRKKMSGTIMPIFFLEGIVPNYKDVDDGGSRWHQATTTDPMMVMMAASSGGRQRR